MGAAILAVSLHEPQKIIKERATPLIKILQVWTVQLMNIHVCIENI